jgi:hypothetical protein
MAGPRSQISLTAVFWTTAAIAFYVAFLSQLWRENVAGVAATLFAHALFWLLTGVLRIRRWVDSASPSQFR